MKTVTFVMKKVLSYIWIFLLKFQDTTFQNVSYFSIINFLEATHSLHSCAYVFVLQTNFNNVINIERLLQFLFKESVKEIVPTVI